MISPEQWQLVEEMSAADVNRLRLRYHGREDMHAVIDQIECRQRAGKKLSDTLRRAPHFEFPSVLSSEQATADDMAAFHASLVGEAGRVLDMTCGLGIDAFHIARTAAAVKAFELTPHTAQCAADNARRLGIGNFTITCGDSAEALRSMPDDAFDCIFVDPARRGAGGKRLFALADCSPDVSTLLDEMLRVASRAVIKASPMLDVSHTLAELHDVTQLIALGTRSECKELIIACQRGSDSLEPTLSAVTIADGVTVSDFRFTSTEEAAAEAAIATPAKGWYVYEPHPATIKMAPFRTLSARFGLVKPAANSHIYFGSERRDDFPGKIFTAIDIFGMSKSDCRELQQAYPRADITTRNFTLRAEELAKKLKMKSGGDVRLFATRDADGKPLIVVAKPVTR